MAAKLKPILSTFAGGELDPWIYGRSDLQRYYNGAKWVVNAITLPTGGFRRRGGFGFIKAAKYPDKFTRLISFEYAVNQSYILELGDLYMRVFTQGASVTMTDLVTVYTETELPDITFAQVGDVMYICHPDHPTQKLIRVSGDDTWTIEDTDFIWGPFLDMNTTSITVNPSATTGSITLTASAALFEEEHVGALWLVNKSTEATTGGYVKITGYTSNVLVNADVIETLGDTVATKNWAEGQWSGVKGYPRSICFFQDRLMLAGTYYNPHTVWGSVSGDPENFAEGTEDDAALDYPLWASTKDAIHWLVSFGQGIYAGTPNGTFRLTGGAVDTPMTPTNVIASFVNSETCNHTQGIMIGNRLIYAGRSGRRLREMIFNFSEDSYGSTDLNYLSYHITDSGLSEFAWQQDPYKILWITRHDGVLLGITYDPKEEVAGWHRHITDGLFKSIAVSHTTEETQLWTVVERTVNGETVQYIEMMDGSYCEDSCYSDSYILYSGVETQTLSAEHLVNKEVTCNLDGATHPLVTVDVDGDVALNVGTECASVGLPFTTTVKTLPLDIMQAPLVTVLSEPQGWRDVVLRLIDSQTPYVNGEKYPVRTPEDLMGEAPPLISGLVWTDSLGWGYDGTITIEASDPLPLRVSAIMGVLELGG